MVHTTCACLRFAPSFSLGLAQKLVREKIECRQKILTFWAFHRANVTFQRDSRMCVEKG